MSGNAYFPGDPRLNGGKSNSGAAYAPTITGNSAPTGGGGGGQSSSGKNSSGQQVGKDYTGSNSSGGSSSVGSSKGSSAGAAGGSSSGSSSKPGISSIPIISAGGSGGYSATPAKPTAWWDRIESRDPTHTVPSTDQIISQTFSSIAGAALDAFETGFGKATKVTNWILDSTGTIWPAPKGGSTVSKYPAITKNLGRASLAIAFITTGLDVTNTWTADSGNTNGQRVIKTGVQIGAAGAAYGVGAFAVFAGEFTAALLAETGPVAIAAGIAVGAGIYVGGNIMITNASDAILEKFEIK